MIKHYCDCCSQELNEECFSFDFTLYTKRFPPFHNSFSQSRDNLNKEYCKGCLKTLVNSVNVFLNESVGGDLLRL